MRRELSNTVLATILFSALVLPTRVSAQDEQQTDAKKIRYSIVDLGTLGGVSSEAFGINNESWAAGVSNLQGDQSQHAFLWRHGKLTDLGTLGGFNSGVLSAKPKDDRGEIAGVAESSAVDPLNENFCGFSTNLVCLGFLWRNGAMTALPTLGGNNAQAFGVNSLGLVVGLAETTVHDTNCVSPQVLDWEAVIWGPQVGDIQELPPFPGDAVAAAISINDKGQVVGASAPCGPVNPSNSAHAVLWENGFTRDLGSLGGTVNNVALAINNQGQAVGFSNLPGDTTQHAFLWQNGVISDLGTLPGDVLSLASGINDRGQVVGGSCDINFNCKAVLWQSGMIFDLNRLIASSSSLFLIFASDINSQGEIVGQAFDQSSANTPAFIAVPDAEIGQSNAAVGAQTHSDVVPATTLPDDVRNRLRRRIGFVLGVSQLGR
jgi:probable HAF family extracellular repeat protein